MAHSSGGQLTAVHPTTFAKIMESGEITQYIPKARAGGTPAVQAELAALKIHAGAGKPPAGGAKAAKKKKNKQGRKRKRSGEPPKGGSAGEQSRKQKRRKTKDPNHPRLPRTAFDTFRYAGCAPAAAAHAQVHPHTHTRSTNTYRRTHAQTPQLPHSLRQRPAVKALAGMHSEKAIKNGGTREGRECARKAARRAVCCGGSCLE